MSSIIRLRSGDIVYSLCLNTTPATAAGASQESKLSIVTRMQPRTPLGEAVSPTRERTCPVPGLRRRASKDAPRIHPGYKPLRIPCDILKRRFPHLLLIRYELEKFSR